MKCLVKQLILTQHLARCCSSTANTSIKVSDQLIRRQEQPDEVQLYKPQRLPPLLSVTDLLKLYKVRSSKRLSQNFLINPKLTKDFIRASGVAPGCSVIEVGPGPGSVHLLMTTANQTCPTDNSAFSIRRLTDKAHSGSRA